MRRQAAFMKDDRTKERDTTETPLGYATIFMCVFPSMMTALWTSGMVGAATPLAHQCQSILEIETDWLGD